MGSIPTPGATKVQVRVGLSGPALCVVRASSGSPSSGIERGPRLPDPAWDHLTSAHAGKESRSIKAPSGNDLPDYLGNDDPCLNIPEGHDEAQFKLHNDCD